jgi:hypothetical protein
MVTVHNVLSFAYSLLRLIINSFALARASWSQDLDMKDSLYKYYRSSRMAMHLTLQDPQCPEVLLHRTAP